MTIRGQSTLTDEAGRKTRMVWGDLVLSTGGAVQAGLPNFSDLACFMVAYNKDGAFTTANAGFLGTSYSAADEELAVTSSNANDDNRVRFLIIDSP